MSVGKAVDICSHGRAGARASVRIVILYCADRRTVAGDCEHIPASAVAAVMVDAIDCEFGADRTSRRDGYALPIVHDAVVSNGFHGDGAR